MKTAQREHPNRWAKVPSNRAPGAVGLNRSCSIYRAAKQEKLQLLERCFFLTSTFIELTGPLATYRVQRLLPASRRYIQKFARRCPDRFGAGLQPPDKVKHSLVDLLGSLLLGPMTATWQQESSPKLRYKLRQDDLVHPRKAKTRSRSPARYSAGTLTCTPDTGAKSSQFRSMLRYQFSPHEIPSAQMRLRRNPRPLR